MKTATGGRSATKFKWPYRSDQPSKFMSLQGMAILVLLSTTTAALADNGAKGYPTHNITCTDITGKCTRLDRYGNDNIPCESNVTNGSPGGIDGTITLFPSIMGENVSQSSGKAQIKLSLFYTGPYLDSKWRDERWVTKYNCVDDKCIGASEIRDGEQDLSAGWKLLGMTQLSMTLAYIYKNADGTEYGHVIKLRGVCSF